MNRHDQPNRGRLRPRLLAAAAAAALTLTAGLATPLNPVPQQAQAKGSQQAKDIQFSPSRSRRASTRAASSWPRACSVRTSTGSCTST